MKYAIALPNEDIDDVLTRAQEAVDGGKSAHPGISYEDGILAGIQWVLGHTEDHPLDA
jgi:hypothetical protein